MFIILIILISGLLLFFLLKPKTETLQNNEIVAAELDVSRKKQKTTAATADVPANDIEAQSNANEAKPND